MIRSAPARAVARVVGVGVLALGALAIAWLLPGAIASDSVVAWLYLSAAVAVLADALVAGANLLGPHRGDRARALARAGLWTGVALVVSLAVGAWAFTVGGVPADEAGYAALLLGVPAMLTVLLAGQTRQDAV
jgi:hypothetical protein